MRGTTTSTAAHMKNVSGRSRPATGGNKRIRMGGSQMSSKGQTKGGMVGRHIKGPDRGDG